MLWLPGPTEVRREILAELAHPQIGHRGDAMAELILRIDPGLRLAFGLAAGSPSTVAAGTHSATAMMEGSLHGVGPRVLCVVNGAFSRRWHEIAVTIGKEAIALEVEWGAAATGEILARALQESGPVDAVTVVMNETSTGVRTPFAPLAAVLRDHPDTMLLADVVSALGGYPVDFDSLGLDFAFAGVQKAFALPPGITVMCASARYLERARRSPRRAWYVDPVRAIDGHVARRTPVTPCIPLYRALARQLEDIGSGRTLPAGHAGATGAAAWRARYDEHERMRAATLRWSAAHDLAPFPAPALSSPTVSCLRAEGIDAAALIAGLKARGHEIGGGYGPLKGRTFRIGHMGDHTEAELSRLLSFADEVLAGSR
ncbi:MAG: aminotransferase class V-fold PLP-dependent enzyme [Planctomycetota bacterium]